MRFAMPTHRKPSIPESANHRTRVGGERREKTRASLLRAALLVFSRHGADARVIDLVIRQAGVSRGTFYNYFRTNEELFFAVAKQVSSEIIHIVEPFVQQQKDPAARVACGVGLSIKLARSYPVLARFVVRGGPPAVRAGSLATEVVSRDIEDGIASGRFSILDKRLGFDLILGPVIMAFHTILTEEVSADYPHEIAEAVLRSLGVSRSLARKFAFRKFDEIVLSEDSIISGNWNQQPRE